MRIERNHSAGKAEAVRRIDDLLTDYVGREFPAGIKLNHHSREWNDGRMDFGFNVSKSIFSIHISGVVTVSDEAVVLDCEVPRVVKLFVTEEQIRAALNKKLDELFDAPQTA